MAKQTELLKSIKILWALLKSEPRWPLARLACLMTTVALTESIGLLVLVPIIDLIQSGAPSNNLIILSMTWFYENLNIEPNMKTLLSTFIVLIGFREWIRYHLDKQALELQLSWVDKQREGCFKSILSAEWNYICEHDSATYSSALLTDINRIGFGLRQTITALSSMALITTYLITALFLSLPMALSAITGIGLLIFLLKPARTRASILGQLLTGSNRKLHSVINESLNAIKHAKILKQEQRLFSQLHQTLDNLRRDQVHFQTSRSAASGIMRLGGAILLCLYLYGGLRYGYLTPSELAVLVVMLARMTTLFSNLHQSYLYWLHSLPAANGVLELKRTHSQFSEVTKDVTTFLSAPSQSISIKHLKFTYPGRDGFTLDDISIQLNVGSITAIVGASGSGKSTLADILMGLLKPDQGQLFLDEHALNDSDRYTWRNLVAYLPQEPFLFKSTIYNNLVWSVPQATEEQIKNAIQAASADFVYKLPQGLNTIVGERGQQLSGGERQRIALARALLKRPLLMILDEPTSSLDPDNAHKIQKVIASLRGKTTVALITHDSDAIALADQIIELALGRITESTNNTYDPLRKKQ